MSIIVQPAFVPIGTLGAQENRQAPVYISREMFKTLEDMARAINTQDTRTGALETGTTSADIVIDSASVGLVLKDTAGHYWRLSVDTDGVLVTTDIGVTP